MIIVSQDKKEVFNVNNIFRLYIDTWSSEEFATEPNCWCIKAEKSQDNLICAFLGEYETEERAKEVLQEIIDTYEKTQYYKYGFEKDKEYIYEIADNLFKYEMPEK